MKESNFADIKYSRKLAWLFPDAEWWWYKWNDNKCRDDYSIVTKDNESMIYAKSIKADIYIHPAITTDMALEVLPISTEIYKIRNGYLVKNDVRAINYEFEDKPLKNALCQMILYLVEEGVIKNVSDNIQRKD